MPIYGQLISIFHIRKSWKSLKSAQKINFLPYMSLLILIFYKNPLIKIDIDIFNFVLIKIEINIFQNGLINFDFQDCPYWYWYQYQYLSKVSINLQSIFYIDISNRAIPWWHIYLTPAIYIILTSLGSTHSWLSIWSGGSTFYQYPAFSHTTWGTIYCR